jgi:hypothetical protein
MDRIYDPIINFEMMAHLIFKFPKTTFYYLAIYTLFIDLFLQVS